MEFQYPYLLFLGDARDQLAAKTANGVRVWRPDWCLGQFRFEDCKADCGVPDMTIEEAAEAGVKLTAAGATFPYKNDPKDTNIRLAPTLPSVEEIKQAMEIVCLCVELAEAEKA